MNRRLEKLNLVGVLLLAVLCVTQWKINRDANLQLQTAQKKDHNQTQKIAEQEKDIKSHLADLETFRGQLTSAKSSEKDLEKKFTESERATAQLASERDQLKTSVTNWAAALRSRDEQLRHAAANLESVVKSRDDAIDKYNDLAKRQNQLIADFNRAATNDLAKAAAQK